MLQDRPEMYKAYVKHTSLKGKADLMPFSQCNVSIIASCAEFCAVENYICKF